MFLKISSILFSICLALTAVLVNGPGFIHEVSSAKTISHGLESPYYIRIQSEDIYGLVQLEFNIPQGLNAKAIGHQDSEVTYSSNSVSLLWDNFKDDEINIELEFTSDVEFDKGEISPTLSFIKNGERIDVDLDKTIIQDLPKRSALDQSSRISCLRHITDEGDGVTRVDIILDGEDFDGFLKITEQTPNNCIVEIIDAEFSHTQIEDGILNFIWFDAKSPLPITVTYKLLGCAHNATMNINGYITYAFGNSEFSEDIAYYIAELENSAVRLNDDQIVEEYPSEKVNNTRTNIALIPDEGVSYRVQLMAGHNDVSESWVANKYNFKGRSDTEVHEGWIKYTTGSYKEYKSARNERENINKAYHFPEPFVTAYYLGERITVGDALIISQQDWLQ
jgi:hypothetical protein